MRLRGKITDDGRSVEVAGGKQFILPFRGTDRNGFPEVLIDAQRVGGDGMFRRQSIAKWIGWPVEFMTANGETGFSFEILGPPVEAAVSE